MVSLKIKEKTCQTRNWALPWFVWVPVTCSQDSKTNINIIRGDLTCTFPKYIFF